jgi:C-terminal processing protease CtpA/Prc
MVEKYSNGQLGYIHIRGMNSPSFESFERELKASGYGKKGIVIDVRYNGGGWTTDRLMAVLNVDQHAYTFKTAIKRSVVQPPPLYRTSITIPFFPYPLAFNSRSKLSKLGEFIPLI